MKKLLCLLIIATLVTGCSSSSPKDEKKEDNKVAETDKSDKVKEDTKETEKESGVKKDEPTNQEETKPNEATSSTTKKNNGDTKQPSNGDSNSNGGSNTGESTQPPQPPVPATPTEQRGKADSVMAQINAYRQQNGKPSFLITNYLLENSKKHAYAMAEKRALWHSGAAECITNYDDPFSAWVNSPEHNKLLLSNNETGAVSIYYVDGYYFSVFQTLP